jgi:hypothetical protein
MLDGGPESRYALQQYIGLLKRLPPASVVERWNINESVDVSVNAPFETAPMHVPLVRTSNAYGSLGYPSSARSGQSQVDGETPPEGKISLTAMSALLSSVDAKVTDCVTPNDYAVRLYRVLDRQFELSAEISGERRTITHPHDPHMIKSEVQRRTAGVRRKLCAADGSAASLKDMQRIIVKLQDEVASLKATIARLRGVNRGIEASLVVCKSLKAAHAQLKQSVRFAVLDLLDTNAEQRRTFAELIGAEATRELTLSSAGGGLSMVKLGELSDEIDAMKKKSLSRCKRHK